MHERRIAGRTGRAVARPGRVARSHVPRVLLAAVALFVALLQVGTAYALPGSEMNGYPLGEILMSERLGQVRATCVYGASNEFFATLCLIGRKSDYLQLSSEQLSELSGEGTGGAFYELSLRWNNYALDGGPTYDDGYSIGFSLAIDGQSLISDPAYIWYGDYSYYGEDSLYQRALADYLTIYNGGHLGGGGTGVGSTFVLDYNAVYKATGPNFDNTYLTNLSSYSCTVALSDSLVTSIQGLTAEYPYVYCFGLNNGTINFTMKRIGLLLSKVALTPSVGNTYVSVSSSDCYYLSKTNLRVASGSTYNLDGTLSHSSSYSFSDSVIWFTGSGSGGGGGGGGGGTWPSPDPTPQPDPPDVPEPDEPTGPGIDPPNPIGYTIDPTDNPNPVTDPYVVVVAPDSQDIIPWLRAILQAINNLGDKLNDESTELQRALNQVFFTNLSKLLKNLKGEFLQDFTQWLDLELEWLVESIESLFLDLQDYLHDLFEWLADQMNFEFDVSTDPYDDTSLLNWLRRIYNKLGADGGPNTRPVDPSTDPEGFLDWLRRMIAEFILGLGASASDFVSDLGDLLSRLFAKFPFSVPWDLLGILGLLDAAPVAPRANFTIPLTIGNQEFNWTVDINLTGWSTYMESVRTIILVSFISWLAWLTPNVLRDLDPGDFL